MKQRRYKSLVLLVFLISFICYGCAKYGEYSKCGNKPETALKALYKEFSDENFDQALHYMSKADSKYYSDLKNELGEENYHESMKINSFLAQNTTWTVKNKTINKDGTAQLTLVFTEPDIAEMGRSWGETIVDIMVETSNCDSDECISASAAKLNPSAIIKDKGPFEFSTGEEEYDFVCENDSWKVDFKINLREQINDEIIEAARLYYKEDKMHEAVRRLKEIPLKYKIDEYDEDLIELILDSIEKEEAEKIKKKEQWNKGSPISSINY